MNVQFTPKALVDMAYWAENDRKKLPRIFRLIDDIRRHPFTGIGDPELLKHKQGGWWSRRIDQEHRLVYRVVGAGPDRMVEISQCRHHY